MPDTVHWSLADASFISLEESCEFLSPAERHKLSTMRFPKRRSEWLLGRWTAKSLVQSLPAYQHYPLEKIEIRNNPKGAPYIHLPEGNISRDCLSLSHRDSQAFSALATGLDLKIGVDLEKVEPHGETFVVDYFTQAEQMQVDFYPVEIRDMLITLIWSVKEAMLKALGVGLHWDTRQVEICEIKGLDAPSGEWQQIQAITGSKNHCWSVVWQRRGCFILTLAGLNTKPVNLLIVEQKL